MAVNFLLVSPYFDGGSKSYFAAIFSLFWPEAQNGLSARPTEWQLKNHREDLMQKTGQYKHHSDTSCCASQQMGQWREATRIGAGQMGSYANGVGRTLGGNFGPKKKT